MGDLLGRIGKVVSGDFSGMGKALGKRRVPDPQRDDEMKAEEEKRYKGGDDYDYVAYEKDNGPIRNMGDQHFPDKYKKPNHITFSNDSIYHSDMTPGGKWEEKEGKWHYTPSGYVLAQHGEEKLTNYFKDFEPDAVLHLPKRRLIGGSE